MASQLVPISTVTVLGAGALGSAVAAAIASADTEVTVWNRTAGRADSLAARGVTVETDLGRALSGARLVLVAISSYDDLVTLLSEHVAEVRDCPVVVLTSATPAQTATFGEWAAAHGVDYLAGAAMSGTALVGDPSAYFLYAGAGEVFDRAEPALQLLGRARYLGDDPGRIPLLDGALLGINLGLLFGIYHAAAVLSSVRTSAAEVAAAARDYLPFALDLMEQHARDLDRGVVSDEDGTLEVYDAALAHMAATARAAGASAAFPEALRAVVREGLDAGHGDRGLASVAEALRTA